MWKKMPTDIAKLVSLAVSKVFFFFFFKLLWGILDFMVLVKNDYMDDYSYRNEWNLCRRYMFNWSYIAKSMSPKTLNTCHILHTHVHSYCKYNASWTSLNMYKSSQGCSNPLLSVLACIRSVSFITMENPEEMFVCCSVLQCVNWRSEVSSSLT